MTETTKPAIGPPAPTSIKSRLLVNGDFDLITAPNVPTIFGAGIKYGRDSGKEKEKKEKLYSKVCGLMDAFTKEFKSTGCMEILGCDLATPEGLDKYKKEGLQQSKCMKLISFAVKETIEISENW